MVTNLDTNNLIASLFVDPFVCKRIIDILNSY